MKKIFAVLFGAVIAFSLFANTGYTVKAAEPDDECTCHELKPITGAERNKIVAKFLSSDEFKAKKLELLESGSKWKGPHSIEVVIPQEGYIMIGVPFVYASGVSDVLVFINGKYVGRASEFPES